MYVVFSSFVSHVWGADGKKYKTDLSALGVWRPSDAVANTNPRGNEPLPVEEVPNHFDQTPVDFEHMTIRRGERISHGILAGLRRFPRIYGISSLLLLIGYVSRHEDLILDGNLHTIMSVFRNDGYLVAAGVCDLLRRAYIIMSLLESLVTQRPWAIPIAILRLLAYIGLAEFESRIQAI